MEEKILYYSGTSCHPYFIEEYKQLSRSINIVPSNSLFDGDIASVSNKNTKKKKSFGNSIFGLFRNMLLKLVLFLGFPKLVYIKTDCEKVFSCGYMVLNKPYIVSFEDVTVFFFHNLNRWNSPLVKMITVFLLKRKNCIGVMPWTNAAKKSFESIFGSYKDIMNKVEVVYPSIPLQKKIAFKNNKIKKILFIGKYFYAKGGYDLLLSFQRLNIRAKLIIVSPKVPEFLHQIINKDNDIVWHKQVTNDEKDLLYSEADLFVMPTHWDTLGYTFFEAMSFGVPSISVNHFAIPEIIEDSIDGFVVDNYCSVFDSNYLNLNNDKYILEKLKNPPKWYIKNLADKIEALLTDDCKLAEFSKNAKNKIDFGKFSSKRKINDIKRILDI